MQIYENTKGVFTVSTDKSKLDTALIQDFLANRSYWAKGIPLNIVEKSIENSVCFGIYQGSNQIGFARIITDLATYGYLCDVFVLEDYRGKGASKFLMECIMQIPDFQGFRRWQLATYDAHTLYEQFGFKPLARPDRGMEILKTDIYLSSNNL